MNSLFHKVDIEIGVEKIYSTIFPDGFDGENLSDGENPRIYAKKSSIECKGRIGEENLIAENENQNSEEEKESLPILHKQESSEKAINCKSFKRASKKKITTLSFEQLEDKLN